MIPFAEFLRQYVADVAPPPPRPRPAPPAVVTQAVTWLAPCPACRAVHEWWQTREFSPVPLCPTTDGAIR